jgi:glycine C-acetyltransferase
MYGKYREALKHELEEITQAGLYKSERHITSAQQARINVGENQVLNMCANNYLGLANNSEIIRAVKAGLDERGFGMASVRFICGTQDIHSELEKKISHFFGTDDTILYSSCFDANAGLFETLLGEKDAIISDALNHASIIDGVRLCKAARFRYTHGDMASLENCLKEAADAKTRMIATDGVFSMDGDIAKLNHICDLAENYDALVMVDDSHATGFVGPTGRGTPELYGVQDRVDVITSTLGKALGGASGGFTTGRKDIIEILRQRSRPYLFSNSLAPPIVSAALKTIDLLKESKSAKEKNPTQFSSESRLPKPVLPSSPAPIPLFPSCWAMPNWPKRQRPCFWKKVFTRWVSFIRWSPKARRAYVFRFPPHIREKIWRLPWRNLLKLVNNWK